MCGARREFQERKLYIHVLTYPSLPPSLLLSLPPSLRSFPVSTFLNASSTGAATSSTWGFHDFCDVGEVQVGKAGGREGGREGG